MSSPVRPVGRPSELGPSETLRVRISVRLGEAIREAADQSEEDAGNSSAVVRRALEREFLGGC